MTSLGGEMHRLNTSGKLKLFYWSPPPWFGQGENSRVQRVIIIHTWDHEIQLSSLRADLQVSKLSDNPCICGAESCRPTLLCLPELCATNDLTHTAAIFYSGFNGPKKYSKEDSQRKMVEKVSTRIQAKYAASWHPGILARTRRFGDSCFPRAVRLLNNWTVETTSKHSSATQ